MHVLGLTDHLGNVGGAEISTQTILNGLASHNAVDKVTVIGIDTPTVSRLDFPAVTVAPVEIPEVVTDLPEFVGDLVIEQLLSRRARKYVDKVDIIHAHHRRSSLALAKLNPSCPTVCTVRDFWPVCPISIYHVGGDACTGCEDCLGECMSYQGWDGVGEIGVKGYLLAKRHHQRPTLSSHDCAIFIAKHLRGRIQGDVDFPDQTEIVYNPVSLDTEFERTEFENPTFLTASSLTDSKGVKTAIRAMGMIQTEYPDSRLVIKGDGPQQDHLEAVAEEVAPNSVSFHGRVPLEEVYSEMAGATATIFPSLWDEPFGRITVESMMLGTPVIGSDVGGIAEVIENGETGLLFQAGNADMLAEQLRRVLDDQNLRQELSQAAMNSTAQFRPENVVQEHVEVYQSLVNNQHTA